MGEASRKAKLKGGAYERLSDLFHRKGIDVSRPGFYDQDAFTLEERRNPDFLERYVEWVLRRPRSVEYDDSVRKVLPKILHSVEERLDREGCRGTCLNASNALSRSLDRLGIWNVVLRGSLVMKPRRRHDLQPVYYPAYDTLDHPQGVTGHAWLSVPPYAVVDVTARHQNRYQSDEVLFAMVPPVVLVESAETYVPDVWDCVVGDAVERYALIEGRRDTRLHYRLLPGLASFGSMYPARKIVTPEVEIRYVANATNVSDLSLDQCGPIGPEGLLPRDIWSQEVFPAFEESGVVIPGA